VSHVFTTARHFPLACVTGFYNSPSLPVSLSHVFTTDRHFPLACVTRFYNSPSLPVSLCHTFLQQPVTSS